MVSCHIILVFVYRILFETGGNEDPVPLPGDTIFDNTDNRYDVPSYRRICKELIWYQP